MLIDTRKQHALFQQQRNVLGRSFPLLPERNGTTDFGKLLEEFMGYLASERGLAEQTIVGYRSVAASFLSTCPCEGSENGLSSLTTVEVNAFLLAECARRSIGSTNNVVVALR